MNPTNGAPPVRCPQNEQDKIALDFIDPLFAVVLNVSFAQVYMKSWFLNFTLIFREPNSFSVATLSLAYLTVILIICYSGLRSTPARFLNC